MERVGRDTRDTTILSHATNALLPTRPGQKAGMRLRRLKAAHRPLFTTCAYAGARVSGTKGDGGVPAATTCRNARK